MSCPTPFPKYEFEGEIENERKFVELAKGVGLGPAPSCEFVEIDYGQLKLSNNLAENAIRPIALGRKNCLHLGAAELVHGSLLSSR